MNRYTPLLLVVAILALATCAPIMPAADSAAPTLAPAAESAPAESAPAESAPADLALTGVITGTLAYRERMALPEGAVVEAILLDMNEGPVPMVTAALTTRGEQVPIPFTLDYDPAAIDPDGFYALGGRILIDGQPRWIVLEPVPALTQGAPTTGFDLPLIDNSEMLAGAEQGGEQALVTGVVTYRDRSALPEGAVVTVQLQDVSRMDVAATLLAEQTIVTTGQQVPISFELPYDPAQIEERNTYAVRATITIDDKLTYVSDTHTPVITRDAPTSDVEIILVRVP